MCSCWWQWKSVRPGLSATKSTSASWYPPIDVLVAELTDCPVCLLIVNAPHESEQSTLGKRRLHALVRQSPSALQTDYCFNKGNILETPRDKRRLSAI